MPNEPLAQKKAREEEIAKTLQAIPLLEERIKYLDERILFYSDVYSLAIDLAENPAVHRNRCLVNQLMKAELTNEREYLLGRIEDVVK